VRVVFDVNVVVRAALGSPGVARLLARAGAGEYSILGSSLLRAEFLIAVRRPRLAAVVDADALRVVSRLLEVAVEPVDLLVSFPECRDPKDRYLLAMVRDGRADFLVTNDDDLLVLERINACEIVRPEEFGRRLETKHDD
jgi:putative PIN family toxin of toxin-antitoxin system